MTSQFPARHRIHGHYATPQVNDARGMSHWLDPKAPNVAALLRSPILSIRDGKWKLLLNPDRSRVEL